MKTSQIQSVNFKGITFENNTKQLLKPIVSQLNDITKNKDVLISDVEDTMGVFTSQNLILKVQKSKVLSDNPIKKIINKALGAFHPAVENKIIMKCVANRECGQELIFELEKKGIFEYTLQRLQDAIKNQESSIIYEKLEEFKNMLIKRKK